MRSLMILTALVAVGASSCATFKAAAERETTRAALVFAARAVVVANGSCASAARVVLAAGDKARARGLADVCTRISRATLGALVSADDALDALDASSAPCAAAKAVESIEALARGIESAGAPVPRVVLDSLAVVRPLAAGGCP